MFKISHLATILRTAGHICIIYICIYIYPEKVQWRSTGLSGVVASCYVNVPPRHPYVSPVT